MAMIARIGINSRQLWSLRYQSYHAPDNVQLVFTAEMRWAAICGARFFCHRSRSLKLSSRPEKQRHQKSVSLLRVRILKVFDRFARFRNGSPCVV